MEMSEAERSVVSIDGGGCACNCGSESECEYESGPVGERVGIEGGWSSASRDRRSDFKLGTVYFVSSSNLDDCASKQISTS